LIIGGRKVTAKAAIVFSHQIIIFLAHPTE